MTKKGLLIVISGPSGAGKGTICRHWLDKYPDFILSISATTRKARHNERDGINYFFKSHDEFISMIENNEFLEYAKVYDNYYGTPKKYVEDQLLSGKDVVLEIDIQGALQVKKSFKEGIFIFIAPPSMDELKKRIVGRGTENPDMIAKRFKSAFDELRYMEKYNYVVVNDTVEEAVEKIQAIVTAEKCRVDRNKELYTMIQGGV